MAFKDKFKNFQEIQTIKGFLLRQPNPETDAKYYFEIFSDVDLFKYYGGINAKPPENIESCKGACDSAIKAFKAARMYEWAITQPETNEVIGRIHLSNFDNNNLTANIGYYLKRSYWGNGIISDCISHIVKFGFDYLELERIYTRVMIENIGSWKALEKNGFQREGLHRHAFMKKNELHDCYMYSKLFTDK